MPNQLIAADGVGAGHTLLPVAMRIYQAAHSKCAEFCYPFVAHSPRVLAGSSRSFTTKTLVITQATPLLTTLLRRPSVARVYYSTRSSSMKRFDTILYSRETLGETAL